MADSSDKQLESGRDLDLTGPLDAYPVLVVQDRYGGCYSGGAWLAISEANRIQNGSYRVIHILDRGPSGDDIEAQEFWMNPPSWIAVGATPDQAVRSLLDASDERLGVELDRKLAEGQADVDAGRVRSLEDVRKAFLADLGISANAAE